MSSHHKNKISAKKHLLNYAQKTYNKLMQEKSYNKPSNQTSRSKKPIAPKANAMVHSSSDDEDYNEILRTNMLVASDSVDNDKELYKQSKDNPVVLSYIIQKLSQLIKKEKISGGTGLKEDVLRFGNDLYKQGQQNSLNQREDDYYGGYVKEERRSNYIRPNFETPGFCDSKPYFDKNYYTNKQNYGKSIGPQRCGRNFINRFCLKILIVNIMLVAFSAWMKYYDIKDPFIQEAYLNNKNQSQGSDYYYHHEENQQNIDQVFDKLNQDLKIMIEDSVNPKPTITLKDYFSFSYVSLALQVFIWIVYFLYPRQK